jgi:hypothetical protein
MPTTSGFFFLQTNFVSCTREIASRVVATRDLDCKVGPVTGHKDPEGEYRYGSTLSSISSLDGVHFTYGKDTHPLYCRLVGPQGRSGRVRKISSSPGLSPRNFQLLASRNTDYAIPAHCLYHRVSIRKHLYHVLELLSVKGQVIT